ncbi:MAG TPA: dihydroorotase [Armatimonadota bacterium]|nr:dihydroorotase [Armatimonadota bacterium]
MSYLIRGGRLLDPASGLDAIGDLLFEDGKIVAIGEVTDKRAAGAEIIPAPGLIVCPGLIDIHVHLREPGYEHKETIASGTAAAAAGGFAAVCAEPNTRPPVDAPDRVLDALARAGRSALVRVYPKACLTVGQRGRELAPAKALRQAGAVALSDDGEPVLDDQVMRAALRQAAQARLPVTTHCEESPRSREVRPFAQPYAAEADLVRRDIGLVKDCVAQPPSAVSPHLHFSHLSLRASVAALAVAKAAGLPVTAEATPHHCLLSADDIPDRDPAYKVNPPLRSRADLEAIAGAVVAGVIDVIASDHAPHAALEKAAGWEQAPFGVIGLESALAVMLTEFVRSGRMTVMDLLARMTCNPARILGLAGGRLAVGAPADVTLLDPDAEWVIDPRKFRSQARNCPFAGRRVRGRAVGLVVGGRVVVREGAVLFAVAGQIR